MGTWLRACGLDALSEGKGLAVTVAGMDLALFRVGDAVYALEDRCPHRGARLSSGVVHDHCFVACLDHGWSIRVTDGQVAPPEQGRAKSYPVEIDAGQVLIEIVPE